jgi:3-isopropylmalate/(R)-2-methylmalate dehydratase small subunit
MAIDKITKVQGRVIPIVGDDIDTDRIIPARYLKCVTFDGLGEFAFYDERFDNEGKSTNHPMDDERFKGGNIILSGNNFGCGSSREHAPQAIKRAGINGIIAESFAEIFYGNSVTLGIVCASVSKDEIKEIENIILENPNTEIIIDVEKNKIFVNDKTYEANIPEGSKQAFLNATYDSLGELLQNMDEVKKLEANLPYNFN